MKCHHHDHLCLLVQSEVLKGDHGHVHLADGIRLWYVGTERLGGSSVHVDNPTAYCAKTPLPKLCLCPLRPGTTLQMP